MDAKTKKPTSFEELPALLTPADISCITGKSAQTVRRLMREGKLPCVKLGRTWYTPKADFVGYVRGLSYGLLE